MCVVGRGGDGGGCEQVFYLLRVKCRCPIYFLRLALSNGCPEQKIDTNPPGTFRPRAFLFVSEKITPVPMRTPRGVVFHQKCSCAPQPPGSEEPIYRSPRWRIRLSSSLVQVSSVSSNPPECILA